MGLIDEKRYKKTIERLQGKKEQTQGQEEAFRRYVSDVGFLKDLPTDRVALGKVIQVNLVPEPGWFDERLEVLTDDQQAEYLRAFGSGTDLGLIAKYAQVRLTSLLRSMIFTLSKWISRRSSGNAGRCPLFMAFQRAESFFAGGRFCPVLGLWTRRNDMSDWTFYGNWTRSHATGV